MEERTSAGRFAERGRSLLRALRTLAAQRLAAEAAAERADDELGRTLEEAYESGMQTLESRTSEAQQLLLRDFQGAIARIKKTAAEEHAAVERARQREDEKIRGKAGSNEARARKELEEAIWATETVFEAQQPQAGQKFRAIEKMLEGRRNELLAISERARTLLKKYRQRPPSASPDADAPPSATPGAEDDPVELTRLAVARIDAATTDAEQTLARLHRLRIARLFKGYGYHLLFVLVLAGAAAAAGWWQAWRPTQWAALVVGGTLVVMIVLTALLRAVARRRVTKVYRTLQDAVRTGLAACDDCHAAAEEERERTEAALIAQRDQEIAAAREKYEPILGEIGQRRSHHEERIEQKYPRLLEEIRARETAELEETRTRYTEQKTAAREAYEAEKAALTQQRDTQRAERGRRRDEAWGALRHAWMTGMERCRAELTAIETERATLFPAWDDPHWSGWEPPRRFSPSVIFGSVAVDRHAIPGGIPDDERLAIEMPERFSLPATLDLPNDCSLLLLTGADGRAAAIATFQDIMLRLLTALPPGKVRFTIIDPVGLGETFAGFMHLADYDESFVNSRIWTETPHIEQRLSDLTEHMETVIQKYLRNEFETIDAYNREAGEIAEPYRFLVISDFPANFSEAAARRLMSIASSGARCGVYTLISADPRAPLPRGITLEDLAMQAKTLVFDDGRCVWKDEDFADLPLTLERPPEEAFLTQALQRVGAAAKDATRVEVPFEVIAPAPGADWSRSCETTLAVPLGRSGATKLQELEIGQGTDQHVLLAGKTGSGKSTLLHVMITNLALWYSPDEVQLYLVDFKKGVEFKTYAEHDLPHARAIAIESDREFGLSVLQRIDVEMKERGDRFRAMGVQDLAGYRRLANAGPMPRILLVVDEFQELFVEDDKIGQDSALLLDRLVRQGRAFGIHVILGTQTLGGAYTLARSTIGQMQVRIALQCTEADSYLILSDDNSAARLLARPGEAIYNDAGGRIEGNNPFQIVWLSDAERETHLARIRDRANEAGYRRAEPLIVFEGSVPADARHNPLFTQDVPEPTPGRAEAWLGEAIAIKGPTAAAFRRQSGNNLLLVGQRDEAALAMLTTSIAALARQGAAEGDTFPRFIVLDGSPVDAPHAGYLARVTVDLGEQVTHVAWRGVENALSELAAELDRRQSSEHTRGAPIYLVVYGLQRYRMLRSSDDFSFSMDDADKPPSPDKLFATVLREGPPHGIHTLVWCDTVTNLNRTVDRNSLREFESRVLFQMSATDSTQLIDSAAAANLGLQRALLTSEEDGRVEKFRPYALPDPAWVAAVLTPIADRHNVRS